MKFYKLKKFFTKKKTAFISLGLASVILLASCSSAVDPQILKTSNTTGKLAKNFNLANLKQTNLLTSLLTGDMKLTNQKLLATLANQLIYNWGQDFISDKTVDKGSALAATQKTFDELVKANNKSYDTELNTYYQTNDKNWKRNFQTRLNTFGGTKNGWLINNSGPGMIQSFIEAVFSKLFLSYQTKSTDGSNFQSHQATLTTLNNPSNWGNIKFMPSENDLAIGNQAYQKSFANFQAFVFNYYVEHERPFIVWNVAWKYGTSATHTINNIYNTEKLAEEGVTIPSAPDYNFPVFNVGDNQTTTGDLSSFNAWQEAVKNASVFNKNTGGVTLNSNITSDPSTLWKLYDNSLVANETDGYLSSAIAHQFNKLVIPSTSLHDQLVNPINLANGSDWSTEQKADILNNFLTNKSADATAPAASAARTVRSDPVKPSADIGIKINKDVIFNSLSKFKDTNFVYPLRDIETHVLVTDKSKEESFWTLVRDKAGASALTIDGTPLISKAENGKGVVKALKQNLLWREAQHYFNPTSKAVINLDLAKTLKQYLTNNFAKLVVQYALLEATNSTTLNDLTSNDYLFSDSQNVLKSMGEQFLNILKAIDTYQKTIQAQTNLIFFRNNLATTVSTYANRPFVKISNGSGTDDSKAPVYYPPYANGLATPLGFKRNLNTSNDDPIFSITNSSTDSQTFSNDGDYPALTSFYSGTKATENPSFYGKYAIKTAYQDLKNKWEAYLPSLTVTNTDLISNDGLTHFGNLAIDTTLNNLITDPKYSTIYIQNLYLANEINFNYRTNDLKWSTNSFSLKQDFGLSEDTVLQTKLMSAVYSILYSSIYTGTVQNINNGKDFIGGFKIQNNSAEDYKSYLKKIQSYWNLAFYSFNDLGWTISDSLMSNYIRTLYSFQWLLADDYKNLIDYLKSQITFNNYGLFVWSQENNLNENATFGSAETVGSKGNEKLKNLDKSFDFVANPGNALSNPYYSYNLSAPTTLTSNGGTQNFVQANAPTQIPESGKSTNEYKPLNGFYGLIIPQKQNPNGLPGAVEKAVFENFNKSNPNGNLTAYNSSETAKLADARGKFFGTSILKNDGSVDIARTLEFIYNQINDVKTFKGLGEIVAQLAIQFPNLASQMNEIINNNIYPQILDDAERTKLTQKELDALPKSPDGTYVNPKLPPLTINLDQKKTAILNILKGVEFKMVYTTNDNMKEAFNKFYNVAQEQVASFHLIKDADLKRFVGAFQNGDAANSIHPNLKYFIPGNDNSRTGFVTYGMQINRDDLSSTARFKAFIKELGIDAFIKSVMYLAQDQGIQQMAVNSFNLNKSFKRLEVYDQRIVNSLGRSWAVLVPSPEKKS